MLGINRSRRPVELGPYPLETLRRDPGVSEEEVSRIAVSSVLNFNDDTSPLVRATLTHLEAYKEFSLL